MAHVSKTFALSNVHNAGHGPDHVEQPLVKCSHTLGDLSPHIHCVAVSLQEPVCNYASLCLILSQLYGWSI